MNSPRFVDVSIAAYEKKRIVERLNRCVGDEVAGNRETSELSARFIFHRHVEVQVKKK